MSLLPGVVTSASPGLRGFDADSPISLSAAEAFKRDGYSFCARYLSRGHGQSSGDLSNAEALNIINAGLGLVPVQHVSASGWAPAAALGTEFGTNAAFNAQSIGIPSGINVWCDLEGVTAGTDASDVIAYCDAWYTAVAAAGYVPGLYVGADCILSGTQLYENLSFQHYWKSLSNVPQIYKRGYQLVQTPGPSGSVNGVGIDIDVTQTDTLGGNVLWLAISAAV